MDSVPELVYTGVSRAGTLWRRLMPRQDLVDHLRQQLRVWSAGLASCTTP